MNKYFYHLQFTDKNTRKKYLNYCTNTFVKITEPVEQLTNSKILYSYKRETPHYNNTEYRLLKPCQTIFMRGFRIKHVFKKPFR